VASEQADGTEKDFAFDHAYWSHDGAKELESGLYVPDGPTSRYADQQMVFDDLGNKILENAWHGYNATLFAYGGWRPVFSASACHFCQLRQSFIFVRFYL
jgi:hypothetical protein